MPSPRLFVERTLSKPGELPAKFRHLAQRPIVRLLALTLMDEPIASLTTKPLGSAIQFHGFETPFRAIKPGPYPSKWTFRPRKRNSLAMLTEDDPRLTIADFASATIFQHGKERAAFTRVPDAALAHVLIAGG
jgi:hypothetical protein